jgi:hypothetical protein
VSEPSDLSGADVEARASAEAGEYDVLPVLSDAANVIRAFPASAQPVQARGAIIAAIPAVQAAAMAAGGFVAGAAVVGFAAHRRSANAAASKGRSRRLGRGGRRRSVGRAEELLEIVGSRSLLVDVHLLGGPSGTRPAR